MKQGIGDTAIILGSIALLVLAAGCGGKETMASRSAAAYQKAVQEGIPIAGEGHGEHSADQTAAVDHAAMGHGAEQQPVDHAAMGHGTQAQPVDHAAMGHGTPARAGQQAVDHAAMGHDTPARAGQQAVDHAAMGHGTPAQPGQKAMDHAAMGHGTQPQGQQQPMDHGAHAAPQTVQPQAAEARPGQPAATLRPDPLDAPAPTSVSDAGRSAAMAREGHMQHGSTTYRQTDAGRESAPSPQGEHQRQAPPPKPPGDEEEKR